MVTDSQVVTVDQDPTLGRVVEARDQLGQVDFPAPVGPTKATVSPARSADRRLDDGDGGVVAEGHLVEDDLAAMGGRSVAPGPPSRRLESPAGSAA
jgi:hypothetical protein